LPVQQGRQSWIAIRSPQAEWRLKFRRSRTRQGFALRQAAIHGQPRQPAAQPQCHGLPGDPQHLGNAAVTLSPLLGAPIRNVAWRQRGAG
jgi:hypothetical protein